MSAPPFDTYGDPQTCSLALIGHVPHSGTSIPPDVRSGLTLSDEELAFEVRRVSDLHTDALYSDIAELGGVTVINRLSRLVVDPERFRDDAAESLARKGAGAVYTVTADGRPLRDPTMTDREDLLTRFYDPYAAHLSALCAALLDRFGAVLIVDCHSFGSQPVGWAEDQSPDRPQVCIGTDDHHTPNALARSLLGIAGSLGYDARRDLPYRGCYVPTPFYRKDPRVRSVLIEIRRDLYMNEATGELNDGFAATGALVQELLAVCRTEAAFIARPPSQGA